MKHLNGHLLCVVDTEVTGLIPGKHEIFEICILPLNAKLEVSREHLPFNIKIKPEKTEDIAWEVLNVTQTSFMELCNTGMDKWEAADLFVSWYEKLDLPNNKRICPLAHNWVFDKPFIQDWLGFAEFNLRFDGRYRDTMSLALAINDHHDSRNEPCPFPKCNLSYLAATLKIDYDKIHTALDDCVLTTKVYKELIYKKY